jgi:methylglutamate dehydrogenase subunit D
MPELTPKTHIEIDDRFQLFEIAGWSEAMLEALLHQLELPFPQKPGDVLAKAGRRVMRITPRLAWVLAEGATLPLPAITNDGVVVDLSNSRLRLRLAGQAADALRRLVAVDFDGLGSSTFIASLVHGIPVTILLAPGAFDVLVPRTFAASLVEWIDDAAAGLTVAAE